MTQTIRDGQHYGTTLSPVHNTNGLTAEDFRQLESSYITRDLAIAAGLYRVDTHDGAEMVGKQPSAGTSYAGIVIPYFWPGFNRPFNLRLRRDKPDIESNGDGTTKERSKYLAQPGARNYFYIPPGTPAEWLTDTSTPVVITEGEKKALALHRFYSERGEKVLVIALSGVWNFRGKLGVERDARGHVYAEIKGVIPDFDKVAWKARRVVVVFDSNVKDEPMVQGARIGLCKELHRRGADVFAVDLPIIQRVNGIDDLLALRGPEYALDVLTDTKAFYPKFALNDLGNGERFVHFHGERTRYSYKAKVWLAYDGTRWRDDDQSKIERLAKETARRIYQEAATEIDEKKQKAIADFAGKSQVRQKVESMLWAARSEVAREIDQFDLNPMLLNVANGTLNLETGEMMKHSAGDYISKIAAVAFDKSATCPKWLAFLDRIFDDEEELIAHVQKAAGYSLTGDISEQCLFIAFGNGANGKTVFLSTLEMLFGFYAMTMPIESLMIRQNSNGPREDIARLRGARLVVASEAEEGQRFAESLIKQLTGGDTITARFLHQNSFEFKPEFKLWLNVNHKPVIRGTDEGIWRRIHLIPFNITIPKDERIPLKEMLATMRSELPGILNWALEGLKKCNADGLKPVALVAEATKGYRAEMDMIGGFIADRCVMGNRAVCGATDLYNEFKAWARENNEFEMTQTAFGIKLSERGFVKGRNSVGQKIWKGVGLMVKPTRSEQSEQSELVSDKSLHEGNT